MRIISFIVVLVLFGSCSDDSKDYPLLTNLKQEDTIKLIAHYNKCGEWGGNIEEIYIFKKDAELYGTLYLDTMPCNKPYEHHRFLAESKAMTDSDKMQIGNYIKAFKLYSKEAKSVIWLQQYRPYYEISIRDSVDMFKDENYSWLKFAEMKSRIFKVNKSLPIH